MRVIIADRKLYEMQGKRVCGQRIVAYWAITILIADETIVGGVADLMAGD